MSNLPSAPGDSAPNDRAIASTLLISSAVGLVCFLGFSALRKLVRDFYAYRLHHELPSPEARHGLFSWIISTTKYPEKLMVRTHGLDTAMMQRVFSSFALFFSLFCVLSMVVLVPINATGSNRHRNSSDPLFVNGLATLSIANLNVTKSSERQRLWIHAAFSCVFVCALMYLISRDYRKFVKYRQLIRKFDTCNNYSVMVSQIVMNPNQNSSGIEGIRSGFHQHINVADGLNSQPHNHSALMSYFQRLFPQKVVAANLVWNLRETPLQKLLERYERTILKLKGAHAQYDRTGMRPQERQSLLDRVDRIDHYAYHARQLQHEIGVTEQGITVVKSTKVGFVTFHDRSTAAVCEQLLLNRRADHWRVQAAPDPKDVFWENLHITDSGRLARWFLVKFAVVVLVLFWSFPLALALSFGSLDKLRRIPLLDKIVNPALNAIGPYGASLLQGLLPVILVSILSLIPKMIIRKLANARGFLTHSESEQAARNYYFSFLLFNVFVLYTLGSGFVYNYSGLTKNVTIRVLGVTLANSVPPQAAFFTSYIIANALIGWLAGQLVRWDDLLLALLQKIFVQKLIRRNRPRFDKPERLHRADPFDYVSNYAVSGLVFVVSITYGIMYPVILPFAALYFVIGYFVVRYNLLYVNVQKYDSLGRLWPGCVSIVLIGLLLHELVMLSLFVAYGFIGGAVLMVLLLIATLIWYRTAKSLYNRPSRSPALEELMFARDEPGRLANDEPSGGVAFSRSPDCVSAYLQPQRKALARISQEKIDSLVNGNASTNSADDEPPHVARVNAVEV